jgi:putative transposase
MGMSKQEEAEQARLERAREIGLFRYMLIREAADPALTTRQRGAMVRAIAAREHKGPSGEPVRLTRWTLDKWIRQWRRGGFDALVPAPRQAQPRTPREVMELAAALKKENPARTAAQVQRILRAQAGWAPDERTIQRMFNRTGLKSLATPDQAPVFGRFEASRPNEIWTGDALHAIRVDGRKTYLLVTWNHRGMAPRDRGSCAVVSPQADRDGGAAGDGCCAVWQVAGSGAARAGG